MRLFTVSYSWANCASVIQAGLHRSSDLTIIPQPPELACKAECGTTLLGKQQHRQCWRGSSQSTEGRGGGRPAMTSPLLPPQKPWCNASKQQKAQVFCWASKSLMSPAITSGEKERGIITSPWQQGHTWGISKLLTHTNPVLNYSASPDKSLTNCESKDWYWRIAMVKMVLISACWSCWVFLIHNTGAGYRL